ncbi:glycosyltransferase family 2 protein [Kouleothrix sp.]|uniref:glycosyltransferase family 2 protein n=1 Tax=Kouleothrix sp. TaxID=2779161 RepID=UPI003918B12A
MRASIVVVTHNSAGYIEACLRAISADMGAHDELIVVDCGSADGTAELVRARFPQARLLAAANLGFAGGNNLGAQLASGEYLVLLNPDTLVRPGAIDALIAPLARHADVGLSTGCVVHLRRPAIVNACGNTMHYTGLTYCRGAGRPASQYAAPADVDAVSGAACAIRRALFEALGGFDDHFFMYVEDTDLSLRARLAGFRCVYAPGALVEHDYRPGYSPDKAFYLDRNRHLMLLKNLRRATYARLLPGLLLGEAVTWGFLLLKGPRFWGVKLRVYRALWAERGYIRAARQAGRALRRRSDRAVLARLTWRLEFGQLASRTLAACAAAVFHPVFWALRAPIGGGRA